MDLRPEIARVGIDTGGTFTDIAWIESGCLMTAKVQSRPAAPEEAVREGLGRIRTSPGLICHGTTVGTNAILARSGGPALMVVTSGFRDVLSIGRGERRDIYSKDPDRPNPVLSRGEILEVGLRIDSRGAVISKPSDDELRALVDRIKHSEAKAIGVGILHSAKHPGEERKLAGKMSGLTGLPVFASAGLSPFPREYERWTLASIAAYLSGVLGNYIAELTEGTRGSRFSLMGSSGGLVSGSEALRNPAISILSGPAGGALAAMSLGCKRVLALDMGGTSTDVTLLSGRLPKTREGSIDGLPVPLPTVDIHTVGAGGGSIVKIDSGGMLGLGPESAGADPGPACYGKGGPASLTDVILLTDRMFPDRFLGGRMKLYPEESLKALEAIRPKNLTMDFMLDILLELTETRLVGALRRISVTRGIDPSAGDGFTLVPFGGAGGFFAVECARRMGLGEVIHPRAAGAFSALGLLHAPIVAERERAILSTVESAVELINTARAELTEEIRVELKNWGDVEPITYSAVVEMRYLGQTHTLEIVLPDTVGSDSLKTAFESAYKARFTYLHDGARVEVVTLRIRGEIPPPRIEPDDLDDSMRSEAGALWGITHMRIAGRRLDAAVLFRDRIPLECEVNGPALVVDDFSTLVLPPDCAMHLDRKGHARILVNQ